MNNSYSEEKRYTEREIEIAYITGLLNRQLTIDELAGELQTAKSKIERLKKAFEQGEFKPEKIENL